MCALLKSILLSSVDVLGILTSVGAPKTVPIVRKETVGIVREVMIKNLR